MEIQTRPAIEAHRPSPASIALPSLRLPYGTVLPRLDRPLHVLTLNAIIVLYRHVLDEPMLRKSATSQLTLLTDEKYEAGLKRIRTAVAESEALREQRSFSVDISLTMVTGK